MATLSAASARVVAAEHKGLGGWPVRVSRLCRRNIPGALVPNKA